MFYADSLGSLLVLYDGTWNRTGDSWKYERYKSKGLRLPLVLTYAQLKEKIYSASNVDEALLDLKLEAVYPCGSQFLDTSALQTDEDVEFLLSENSRSISHRTALCATPVQKAGVRFNESGTQDNRFLPGAVPRLPESQPKVSLASQRQRTKLVPVTTLSLEPIVDLNEDDHPS